MKRVLTLLTLLLALAAGRVLAYQEVVKKVKCPLCGAPVAGTVFTQGTRTGLRLDLKPLGDVPTPMPLLVCPGCSFVLFQDHLSPALKDSLNGFVKSDAYRNTLPGNTSYFMLGQISEFRKMPAKDIAYAYLNAGWQTEDDTARYHQYLELARQFYAQAKAEAKDSTNEDYVSLCLQECELLRLLGRFDEAGEAIAKMKKNYLLDLSKFDKALELEKKLMAGKNSQPEVMDWKKGKINWANFENQAYGLPGFDAMQAAYEMDSLYIGKAESYPNWYFLVSILHPRAPALLNRIYWYIDYDSKKLLQTWQVFLKTQDQISAKVEKLEWLRQWQQADSNRVVETRFLGTRPNAINDLEKDKVQTVWAHSRLKGSPDMQVKLYRQDHCFCTVYFNAKDERALIYTARSGRGTSLRDQMMRDADSVTYFKSFGAPLRASHWLDTLEVDYSSSQPVPSYAVVEPDGKYAVNDRRRGAE